MLWLLPVATPRAGHAEPQMSIDVPAHGGAYVIDVHEDVLTLLQFPATIERAYAVQDPPAMMMEKHTRAITVQPLPGTEYANLVVNTEAFSVSILFRVVARAEDATVQVDFRPFEMEREVALRAEAEVARRWSEARAVLDRERAAIERQKLELARKQERLQELIHDAAVQQTADSLRARHRTVAAVGLSRRAHVLVRLERVIWLGADAYVVFSIHNRRPEPLRLAEVLLRAGGVARADAVSFPRPEGAGAHGILGLVPSGDRQVGVAVLRKAAHWVGERVALDIVEDRDHTDPAVEAMTLTFWLRES